VESGQAVADRIERIPRPEEPVPPLAWPTVGLLIAGLGLLAGSSALYLNDLWPWPVSTILNWIALFMLFTVAHEASHRTISTDERINTWFGRVATFFLDPLAGFQLFRFVHMQHHRFTNDETDDPDFFSSHGKQWTLPIRWATIDINYLRYYIPKLGSRPLREKVEAIGTWVVFAGAVAAALATGLGFELLVLWIIPSRLAILGLGFSFDYLPHHGLPFAGKVDQFRTTRNRVGLERLLTPVMLYQNYHLVHHLHPIIPFYSYIRVWRRNEEEYLKREPPLSTVLGRPLTVAEYRRLRELEH
jgi:fatty acid desaturase